MEQKLHVDRKSQKILLLSGLLATFLPVLLIEIKVLAITKGVFIYPVDDTFIHLELAKNLAESGNWGINSSGFSSASSSILYTLLLAGLLKIFSSGTLLPFILNSIAAIFLLVAVNKWLARQQLKFAHHLLVLLLVIFFTPLPILIMGGMEHTFQCLFSFLFLFTSSEWISNNKAINKANWKLPWHILALGILVTAIRYEGIFLIAIVCLILVYYRRIASAFQLGLVALLPVLIFGIVSVTKGSYFFPNSVLIKSDEVPLFGGGMLHFVETILLDKLTFSKAGITAMATQRLLLILPLCGLVFLKNLKFNRSYLLVLGMLTGCVLLHLSFASTGKFYRYEAYLVLCSILICGTVFFKSTGSGLPKKFTPAFLFSSLLFFFLVFPLVLRSTAAFSKAGQACINIYEQQYQMGQFLKAYYPATPVGANDIGAVAYFTQGPVLDLWGLGSIEVTKSRRNQHWSPAFLDSISREGKVKLAIIYDSWFQHSLGQYWKKLATWQINNNVVCGDDIVSFYAVDTTMAGKIKEDLQLYQRSLPAGVTVHYY